MSYATLEDFLARFGEAETVTLTDFAQLGAVDGVVLNTALADASSIVDGYVGGRYSTPLVVVPAMICNVVCDIARFQLFKTEANEAVKSRYEKAISLLRDVSASRLDLGPNNQGQAQLTEGNTILFGAGRPNIFGRGV